MGTEREHQHTSDGAFARSSSADLLELVREAEDEARLSLRKRTPAVAVVLPVDAIPAEPQVVDVDDLAVEEPASTPSPTAASRPWPPALGITVLLALAVGALALVAR